MTTCKVAFVGAGSMTREHVRAFRDVPCVEIAGLHSRTRARAEALAEELGVPIVADSVDELYAKTQARLVVVSVPELSAREVLEASFRHGWTVLAEKPAGYDLADAERVAQAAARGSRRCYVALNRRHYSATHAAQERLASDTGQRFISVQDQQDPVAALAAGQPERVVANWMFANSIHVVDYLRVFGRGAVIDVEQVVRWDPAKSGTVVAKIGFASGDIGLYTGIWNGPGPWAAVITTPSQRLELRPLEQLGVQKRGERKLDPQPVEAHDTAFKAGFRVQAQKAVDAALGRATDLPTLEDGLETMRLVSRIFGRA